MYRNELEGLIFAKKVPNYILLRGIDEFQNELYAKILISYFGCENLTSMYFDDYDYDKAVSFFEPSLFGGKNTLYIKTNKTLNKKEIKNLISMTQKDELNHFIYELDEDGYSSVAKDFTTLFNKNEVRFFKPNSQREALNLLENKCKMCKIMANNDAALLRIYQIHNENLSLCANEIEKFARLGIEISLENVNKIVSGLSEVSFEDLFEKILDKKDFRDDFFLYTKSGSYDEMEFINFFYRSIFKIFKIHSYAKIYGNFDFKAIFGYAPPMNIQQTLKRRAGEISTKKFFEIFKHLNETEFSLKTEQNIDKQTFLLAKLLELQRILIQK